MESVLTKRELIAAMALQGLLSGYYQLDLEQSDYADKNAARDAVLFADLLLEELEKRIYH